MSRLCIVGCGLTAAITASLLKQQLPHLKVTILEKARGTGGRFCTSRSSFDSTVDLGAQFITKSLILSEVQKKCYSELVINGLLEPVHYEVEGIKNDGRVMENFICPQGSGSVVKHFLRVSGCEILFDQRVIQLSKNGNKWKLKCESNSDFEFDAVILTIPVPQIFQMKGILSYLHGEELENMKFVTYSSRFALGLFYDKDTLYFDGLPWIAKYFSHGNVLRFCSVDHKKRNSSNNPSVAIHTTKEFGKLHIDDSNTSAIQEIIMNELEKVFPSLPNPSFIKFHKWRYSQVEESYTGKPGCIQISTAPLLIAGGDGFSWSNFEGCIHSSESIAKNVIDNYK